MSVETVNDVSKILKHVVGILRRTDFNKSFTIVAKHKDIEVGRQFVI